MQQRAQQDLLLPESQTELRQRAEPLLESQPLPGPSLQLVQQELEPVREPQVRSRSAELLRVRWLLPERRLEPGRQPEREQEC